MHTETGAGAGAKAGAGVAAFVAVLLALASTSDADEALPMDGPVRVPAPGGAYHAIATPDPERIAIVETARLGQPDTALWAFADYRRDPMLSEDGRTLLLVPRSGPLLATDDPDQVVLTLVRAPGVPLRTIRLGEVIGADDLERTVSHWRWMERIAWAGGAWTLLRPDGSRLRIAVDGTLEALP